MKNLNIVVIKARDEVPDLKHFGQVAVILYSAPYLQNGYMFPHITT